jgi:hypothetical protein
MTGTTKAVGATSTPERLARIETKLDVVLAAHEDREIRIRSLERRYWIALGFAGASVAANVGGLVTYLGQATP